MISWGGCFSVYKDKGCGFLEPVYQECLEIEFDFLRLPRSRAGVAPGFQLPHRTGSEYPSPGPFSPSRHNGLGKKGRAKGRCWCPFCSPESAPPRHETGGAGNRKNTKHVGRDHSITTSFPTGGSGASRIEWERIVNTKVH